MGLVILVVSRRSRERHRTRSRVSGCGESCIFMKVIWRQKSTEDGSTALSPDGGGSGIRTHGGRESSPVFKTGAFNRSAIPPRGLRRGLWRVDGGECKPKSLGVHEQERQGRASASLTKQYGAV